MVSTKERPWIDIEEKKGGEEGWSRQLLRAFDKRSGDRDHQIRSPKWTASVAQRVVKQRRLEAIGRTVVGGEKRVGEGDEKAARCDDDVRRWGSAMGNCAFIIHTSALPSHCTLKS